MLSKFVLLAAVAAVSGSAVAAAPYRLGIAGWSFHQSGDDRLGRALEVMREIDCHYLCHKDFFLPYDADQAAIDAYAAKLSAAGVSTLATGPLEACDEASMRRQFEFAKRAGLKVVVGVPFEYSPTLKTAEGEPAQIESDRMLDVAERLVKEFDVRYAIHNHGPDYPHMYPTAESVWARIRDRDPRIGFCLDVGHQRRAGLDPCDAIRKYAARIYDVHLKNIVIDAKRNLAVQGPRGELDVPAILKTLAEVGYAGVCHVEYERDYKDNAMGLAESIGYYRGVMDAVGGRSSAKRGAGETVRLAPADGDSTRTVQAAIDRAFRAGGGVVRLQKGVYAVGGLRLRSRVTLYLESGAMLKGSRNIDDYFILEKDTVEPVDPAVISHEGWYQSDSIYKDTIWRYPGNRWNNALIRLYKAEDAAIVGEPGSLIDGSNPYDPEGEEEYRGPLGVNAIDCKRLTFRGYTTNNTGNWAHRLVDVEGFTFDGVTCLGGHDSVHFNGCDDVLIENCTFKTGDDCVAGFDNHRVTVRNCYINSSCSAFRFAGNDVLVEKCTIRGPGEWGFRGSLTKEQKMAGAPTPPGSSLGRTNMLSFFTYYADGTHPIRDFARHIVIRDCTVENTDRFLHYNYNNEQWQRGVPMTDITFERVTAKGIKLPLCACGARGHDVKLKLTLKDCDIAFADEVDTFIRGSYLGDLVLENVRVSGVRGSLLLLKGGEEPKVRASGLVGTDGSVRTGDFDVKGI